jgi:hypothetical protein
MRSDGGGGVGLGDLHAACSPSGYIPQMTWLRGDVVPEIPRDHRLDSARVRA